MNQDKTELDRIIFFSDAVFAIAITLLTFDIKLPKEIPANAATDLSGYLLGLVPEYQNYVVSFLVIGSYWIGHHHFFRYIKRYDYFLVFLNIGLLMCVAFLPFPTEVLDSFAYKRSAVVFYAGSMAMTGLINMWIWKYASYRHRLIDGDLTPQRIRTLTRRALIPPLVFSASIGIALFNPTIAEASWGAIALIYIVSEKIWHQIWHQIATKLTQR